MEFDFFDVFFGHLGWTDVAFKLLALGPAHSIQRGLADHVATSQ